MPTIPHDYHMHSNSSIDSEATMAEMCEAALQNEVGEIAFAEHYDCHPDDYGTGYYDPETYFARLEEARREYQPLGLTVRAGVELGEPHLFADTQQPTLAAWPYDIVLGSLHWIGPHSVFDDDYYQQRTPAEAITPYFVELAEMVRAGGFDVLAHADVVKRVACRVYGSFDITQCETEIRNVWQACIETGTAIEINTAGLRTAANEQHPSQVALQWYYEMGGRLLTTGSDAHRPTHVALGLVSALDLAREVGFTQVCIYEKREVTRWVEI